MLSALAFSFNDIFNGTFFDWIITWCSNIFGFLVNWVRSLITSLAIISNLPNVALVLPSFFPVVISTSITLCLVLAITKAILFQDQQ